MASHMTPEDIFNSLTPEEKDRVLRQYSTSPTAKQTPCEKNGHKFKAVANISRMFQRTKTKFVCTACGEVKVV